jgi:type IV secretion system protein VirB10
LSATIQPATTVARGRLPMPAWLRMTLLGGGILGASVVGTWYFIIPSKHPAPPPHQSADFSMGKDLPPLSNDMPGPEPAAPAKATPQGPGPAPAPIVRPMTIWGAPSNNTPLPPASGARIASTRAPITGPDADPDPDAGSGNSAYGSMLQPTKTETGEAGVDRDVSLLLPQSKSFECIPQSPVDTQLIGGISCVADENVWSQDGSNILIHRFDVVSGEIQRGIGLGQNRAFILWTRVRSKRVHAELNSPATDGLGQMGVPGIVDEHWWPRIKAAVLLTGVETASGVLQNEAAKSGNTNFNLSTGQSLASTALQHDINIPSTLWRGQGWPLRVYVQHDIQFRRAYNNVLVAGLK